MLDEEEEIGSSGKRSYQEFMGKKNIRTSISQALMAPNRR